MGQWRREATLTSDAEYAKYTPKHSQMQPSGRPAQIHQIYAKYRQALTTSQWQVK